VTHFMDASVALYDHGVADGKASRDVEIESLRQQLAEAHEAGRVAEREECAKVCDEIAEADNGYWCAMTIRARSTKA
jgi:hypothetical protein